MAWNDRAVTLQGLEMLRRCLGGEVLTLDYAGGGAGVAPAASLMTQNALADQRQTFTFGGGLAEIEAGRRVNILITSAGLAQGYTLRQVGIWAHVGDDTPALFAVIQDAEGIPIYSEADFPDFALNFYTVLAISSAADVTVHVDPSAMASMADMQAAVDAAVGEVAPIAKSGAPDDTTPGTVGQHYLDTDSGKEYVCLGEKEGAYQWKPASAGTSAEIAYGDTTVEAALDNFSEAISNAVQSILTHAGSSGHITEQERTNWNSKVPATRTVNGKSLASDITLSAADVHARPNTWTPTAADVGAVPTSRTVNGKALSTNVTLFAEDIGALPAPGTAAAATKLETARTIRTNLASTSTASFDGTANVTSGVTGTLPVANGGTGATTSAGARTALGVPNAKRTARFTVGTSTAGWTADQVDYLCDGTADQVEINAAITALPATGGEVIILDGTYNLTGSILVNKDRITLSGNAQSTFLKRAASGTSSQKALIHITSTYNTVKFLSLDGVKSSYSSTSNYGIYLSGSNNTVTGNTCIRGTGGSSDYTSSQYTIHVASNCDKNLIADNNIMGKNYLNAGTGNTFSNNKYN